MNRYFFATLIFCSASARWPGTQESNYETFIRISKAAAIGAGAGAINGELGKKMAFGEQGLHLMTFAAGHSLNYKLNDGKKPTISELWAYGISQATVQHAASTPDHILSTNLNGYKIQSNVTLSYAAFETVWYIAFGNFCFWTGK